MRSKPDFGQFSDTCTMLVQNARNCAGAILLGVLPKGWLRGVDLNHRPLGYEPNELPGCSTPHLYLTQALRRSQACPLGKTLSMGRIHSKCGALFSERPPCSLFLLGGRFRHFEGAKFACLARDVPLSFGLTILPSFGVHEKGSYSR